jgi:hypothetical protein
MTERKPPYAVEADLLYAAAFRLFGIHAWIMEAWAIALGLALCWVITGIASRILHSAPISNFELNSSRLA